MDINATIIGQFIVFAILVWVTMKFIWPQITKAMHEREKKIAAGLEAAERGERELETAEQKAISIIRDAKQQATRILEQANVQSAQLLDEAKTQAKVESDRIINMAQGEIDREVLRAREALKGQLAKLAITGAEKILKRNLDAKSQHDLLNDLAAEM